ncbi:MAG: hypothetical protein JXB47_14095 [Anaerolineae bacterium]|nr:hypothetical protein [Anaerolineae bacterium]
MPRRKSLPRKLERSVKSIAGNNLHRPSLSQVQISPHLLQRAIENPTSRTLTPDVMRRLQHTHGNHFVAGLVQRAQTAGSFCPVTPGHAPGVIQRALMTDFLTRTDDKDTTFQNIDGLIKQYNQAAGESKQTLEVTNKRFSLLRQIDRAAYKWFDTVSQAKLRLSENSHTPVMKDLLKQTETEHINLIQATKDNTGVLPIDTSGMEQKEVKTLETLWRSIAEGTSKIKLVGSKEYNAKTLARLAKILDTPTGQKLLGFLNAAHGDTEQQTEEDLTANIYIGEKIAQLPKKVRDASSGLTKGKGSAATYLGKAQARRELGSEETVTGKENPKEYPTVTKLVEYREALLGGQAKGVIFNKKKYTFNKGIGSFVKIAEGEASLAGTTKHQTLTPSFVTLAHELGHAANIRGGAATPEIKHGEFFALGGLSSQEGKEMWSEPEELLNITNIENAIRSESQLSARYSHLTFEGLLKKPRTDFITKKFEEFNTFDRSLIHEPNYQAFLRGKVDGWIKEDLDQKNVWTRVQKEIGQFAGELRNDKIPHYKEKFLRAEHKKLKEAHKLAFERTYGKAYSDAPTFQRWKWGWKKTVKNYKKIMSIFESSEKLAKYTACGVVNPFGQLYDKIYKTSQAFSKQQFPKMY